MHASRTSEDAREELRRHPDLALRLALSAVEEAEHLRATFVNRSLGAADAMREKLLSDGLFPGIHRLPDDPGPRRVACFVDGGVGKVELLGTRPVLVRAALFRIAEGERDLSRRETFAFFPVVLGELGSGEKKHSQYVTVVRAIVELGALVRSLNDERFDDVNLLMLHGPLLLPLLGPLQHHWFSRNDLIKMLDRDNFAERVVDAMIENADHYATVHVGGEPNLRAVVVIRDLARKAIAAAAQRQGLICGVVERSSGSEGLELLARHLKLESDDFKTLSDELLLALVLRDGEYLTPFQPVARYRRLSKELAGFEKTLPRIAVTWLKTGRHGTPIRVEFPENLTAHDREVLLIKIRHYASLLPNYTFPLGLDVADKMARVPTWLSAAYRDAIMHELATLLSGGDKMDANELVRLLCFTSVNRGVLGRPEVA